MAHKEVDVKPGELYVAIAPIFVYNDTHSKYKYISINTIIMICKSRTLTVDVFANEELSWTSLGEFMSTTKRLM